MPRVLVVESKEYTDILSVYCRSCIDRRFIHGSKIHTRIEDSYTDRRFIHGFYLKKCLFYSNTYGAMVSIPSFQVGDSGSIPDRYK
jgi:hypothetical protein